MDDDTGQAGLARFNTIAQKGEPGVADSLNGIDDQFRVGWRDRISGSYVPTHLTMGHRQASLDARKSRHKNDAALYTRATVRWTPDYRQLKWYYSPPPGESWT